METREGEGGDREFVAEVVWIEMHNLELVPLMNTAGTGKIPAESGG